MTTRTILASAFAAAVLMAGHLQATETGVGSVTGYPVPRYVALKSDKANARTGPGTRYPIRWTYQRKNLPVQVVREYGAWRQIHDPSGDGGWVHQMLLSGNRTALVTAQTAPLLDETEPGAEINAHLSHGVIVHVGECDFRYCHASVGDHEGYVLRSSLWGATELPLGHSR